MASFVYYHIESDDRCVIYFGNHLQVFKGAAVVNLAEAEELVGPQARDQYTKVLVRPKVAKNNSPQNSVS